MLHVNATGSAKADYVRAIDADVKADVSDLLAVAAESADVIDRVVDRLPEISFGAAAEVADKAQVYAEEIDRSASILKHSSAEAEAVKLAELVAPEGRAKALGQLFARRASRYGGKPNQAAQTAKRSAMSACLLRTFNPPRPDADNPAIPAAVLVKVFGSWPIFDKTAGAFVVRVPTYGSDGRKVPGLGRAVTAADVAAVRKAARKSIGKLGGLNVAAFRSALADVGLLPPPKASAESALPSDDELQALYLERVSAAEVATPESAMKAATALIGLMQSGGASAAEALAALHAIKNTFNAVYASALAEGEQSAADELTEGLGDEYADDSAEVAAEGIGTASA